MALAKFYKFVVKNKTGVAIAASEITLLITRSKIGPADVAINHEVTPVTLTNPGIIAIGGFGDIGAVQDNTIGQFLEGHGQFKASISTLTPNGDVVLYIAEAPNNTAFADNARLSFPISAMNITVVSNDDDTDFRF